MKFLSQRTAFALTNRVHVFTILLSDDFNCISVVLRGALEKHSKFRTMRSYLRVID